MIFFVAASLLEKTDVDKKEVKHIEIHCSEAAKSWIEFLCQSMDTSWRYFCKPEFKVADDVNCQACIDFYNKTKMSFINWA